METTAADDRRDDVTGFLSRVPPFTGLTEETRQRYASLMERRHVEAGEDVIVEQGAPGTRLYVVWDGSLEMVRQGHVVDVLTSGQVFGHPTLLSGLPPEFTVRGREPSVLLVLPGEEALDLLSRSEGVVFVARTQRERLLRTLQSAYDEQATRAVPVSQLVHRQPVYGEPDESIREVASRMSEEGVTAALVRLREGLGIVTDSDMRDKVLLAGRSGDEPVSTIMTTPVVTAGPRTLAPEASIEMLSAGVEHLPVVDAEGRVLGVLSAANLMSLDELSPFALRQQISRAHDENDLIEAAGLLPRLFLALLDGHLDAPSVTRVFTVQVDAITTRLVDLSVARNGPPPVAFAWLALGSGARGEMALTSDQDNALAYADSDDPAVEAYFERLATDVNEGLARCGLEMDYSGVNPVNEAWRLTRSEWQQAFRDCFVSPNHSYLIRASIVFDFRQVVGDLDIVPPLTDALRTAADQRGFLMAMASEIIETPSPLGFRRRLRGEIDVKKNGLLPLTNLARFHALANAVTVSPTLERLSALENMDALDGKSAGELRQSFQVFTETRLAHQADDVRAGRTPTDVIDTSALGPLRHAELQEAMRFVDSTQQGIRAFPMGMRP